MANRTPPKRPSIESLGTKEWLGRRNISYDTFLAWVGNNPDDPTISKQRLAKEIGTSSKETAYRLLRQYKRELNI